MVLSVTRPILSTEVEAHVRQLLEHGEVAEAVSALTALHLRSR